MNFRKENLQKSRGLILLLLFYQERGENELSTYRRK